MKTTNRKWKLEIGNWKFTKRIFIRLRNNKADTAGEEVKLQSMQQCYEQDRLRICIRALDTAILPNDKPFNYVVSGYTSADYTDRP